MLAKREIIHKEYLQFKKKLKEKKDKLFST